MRLEELPRIYAPETLSLMGRALEQAWQELKSKGEFEDEDGAKRKLTRTIVALASVGETDSRKLKAFAVNATRVAS